MESSSSCMPIEWSPRGREGIGVIQPQSGLHYPFVLPSPELRYLIADAYLAYEDPSTYDSSVPGFVLPFKLAWVSGLGCTPAAKPGWAPTPTHPVDLLITDANDEIVFNSTLAVYHATTNPYAGYHEQVWGDDYLIHEWRTADAVCRIVVYTTWPPDEIEPQDFAEHIVPENGTLDGRVLFRTPRRVKSLTTVLNQFQRTNVDLVGGYNIELTNGGVRTIGRKRFQRVVIDGAPGGGLGIFPGCDEVEDLVVRAVNGVRPTDAGDFLLAASECYWVRPPTVVTSEEPRETAPVASDGTSAHLQLGNDCVPCCDCQDFVNTALYMNQLHDLFVPLAAQISNTRDVYHENRDRWLSAKSCREAHPLRLVLRPQTCPFMDVVAQFCNQTDRCLYDIELILRFKTTPEITPSCDCVAAVCGELAPAVVTPTGDPPVVVFCGHTFLSNRGTSRYVLQGEWCEYRAKLDAVNAFTSAYVKFRLQFPNAGIGLAPDSSPTPYVVEGCLTATMAGRYVCAPLLTGVELATTTQSATLECPQSITNC